MGGLFRYVVEHRTAANLLALGLVLLGLYGALNIRAQYFPDVVIESISVRTAWPGAGPAAMDAQVAALLDPVLLAVDGVERLDTSAREGVASFTLTFEPGADMGRAVDEVRAALDGVDDLPDDADAPTLRRSAFFDRVTDVAIWGPAPRAQLTRIAQALQARLFEAGVTRVSLTGAPDPVIRIAAREMDLLRHDVTLAQIADAVRAAASASPAGDIADGAARVLTGVDARSVEALAAATLRVGPDGDRLTVGDVADVYREDDRAGEAHVVDAHPAVFLSVSRDAQGDAIAIQRAVQDAVAALQDALPDGVRAQLTRTQAAAIGQRLDLLIDNGLLGLALVLGLLFLFLSARTAFWVAAGIPVAMAAAIGLMYLTGLTLNMISMFALIICLGVVVDDAIVVGEHADALARRGMAAGDAARTAAQRMLAPVFAASVTTVIAFLGLMLVGGRFGALIVAIPLTVSMVLIASLIESFLILPAHMRHALAAKRAAPWYDAPSRMVDRGFRHVRERLFRPLIVVALRWRYPVMGAILGLLLHSVSLLTGGEVRWRFFDGPESSVGSVNFAMLPGAARADTAAQVAEIQRARDVAATRFEAEHGRNPILFTSGVIGDNAGRRLALAEGKDADLLGGVTVELIDGDLRPYSLSAFMQAWRAEIVEHPRLEALAGRGERSGPGEEAISVDLIGPDPLALKAAAEALRARLEATPAVSGVEVSLGYGKQELTLALTPLGSALGFDVGGLGATLRARLTGVEAAAFPLEGRAATVLVSADPAAVGADYLERTAVRAPGGGWVSLGDVAVATPSEGFSTITRRNGAPVVSVTAQVDPADPAAAQAAQTALERDIMPDIAAAHDLEYLIGGLRAQERRFLTEALTGFVLCVGGIYLTLAWIFASWSTPLVVLLAAPLGLIGVLWGHYWMDVSLSMFSVVGLLGMTGIIINDAIVLVTTADETAKRRAVIPALADAACDRLRAVFLTTATTVAGLAPMLFEGSRQAQFLKPTVITLCFGLGFGMLLVLVATPAMVAIKADIGAALRSMRRMAGAARRGRLSRRPRAA